MSQPMPDQRTAEEKVDFQADGDSGGNPYLKSDEHQKRIYRALAVRLQSRIDRAVEVLNDDGYAGRYRIRQALRILQEK